MILLNILWDLVCARSQELKQVVEYHWAPMQLKVGQILGKNPCQLRFFMFSEQITLQIKMALFHLNMDKFFFSRDLWRVGGRVPYLNNRTNWVALHELRSGLRLLHVPRRAPRLQHVLNLNYAFSELESQIPLMVVIQRAVVLAKISGLTLIQINFLLWLFDHMISIKILYL